VLSYRELSVESLAPQKRLVEQTYEHILDAVCDGTLKAGERLTQEDIAARLNVSRQPVTHALALLKAQGFVEASGRRGLQVTAVEPRLLKEIYELRSALEPLAVELATPRLTRTAIANARAIISRGRRGVAEGDKKTVLEADIDFHSFVYDASGNRLVGDTMQLHWRHLRRAMGEVLQYPGMSTVVWREHHRILASMIRGDASDAANLMRAHLLGAFRRVSKNSPAQR
jgi:DNA-binding GntR family transcriptional regulator